MSVKQPEPVQYEFDFGETYRECVCAYPRAFDGHVTVFDIARSEAMLISLKAARVAERQSTTLETVHEAAAIFSIADKLAEKQTARDEMLYESILARIKHLPFA